jgi:hypothetical protein
MRNAMGTANPRYSSDIDYFRLQYGAAADVHEMADCIQEVRDDYQSCLDDFPRAANPSPCQRALVANTLAVWARSADGIFPKSTSNLARKSC